MNPHQLKAYAEYLISRGSHMRRMLLPPGTPRTVDRYHAEMNDLHTRDAFADRSHRHHDATWKRIDWLRGHIEHLEHGRYPTHPPSAELTIAERLAQAVHHLEEMGADHRETGPTVRHIVHLLKLWNALHAN